MLSGRNGRQGATIASNHGKYQRSLMHGHYNMYYLISSANLKRCAKCLELFYCGPDCQKMDWKECHKFECSFYLRPDVKECLKHIRHDGKLSSDGEQFLESVAFRLAVRLQLKAKNDPDVRKRPFELFDCRQRFVDDLVSNSNELIAENPVLCTILRQVDVLMNSGHQIIEGKVGLIERFGQIKCNSFGIDPAFGGGSSGQAGGGLFIEASIFDHSCRSNACNIFNGLVMQVRALEPIDTEVDTIYISYCDKNSPRHERQFFLKHSYFFDCKCSRCSSTMCDDNQCTQVLELEQTMTKFEEQADYVNAFKAAKSAFELNQKVLGHYSTNGTNILIAMMDISLKKSTAASPKCSKSGIKVLRSLLNQVRDHVRVTAGSNCTYYQNALTNFDYNLKQLTSS